MTNERESVTAKLCAFARAYHSNFSREKIFDDYLAFDMLGKDEYDELYQMLKTDFGKSKELSKEATVNLINEYMSPIPLSRISFCEERLLQFAQKNEKVQYVICGAGSDTFSFRNANENIEIFEIDHPDTQRYKKEKIKKLEWIVPKNVHFVSVDFEKESMTEKLLPTSFDIHKKTFFSILGVSYYLTLDVFAKTLKQMSELSSLGSELVFDFPMKTGSFPERVYRLEKITESLGEKMQGGFEYAEVSRALYSLGFQINAYMKSDAIQKEYFGERKDKMRAFENVNFISAEYTAGYNFE